LDVLDGVVQPEPTDGIFYRLSLPELHYGDIVFVDIFSLVKLSGIGKRHCSGFASGIPQVDFSGFELDDDFSWHGISDRDSFAGTDRGSKRGPERGNLGNSISPIRDFGGSGEKIRVRDFFRAAVGSQSGRDYAGQGDRNGQ
jgi:hypothetical protein